MPHATVWNKLNKDVSFAIKCFEKDETRIVLDIGSVVNNMRNCYLVVILIEPGSLEIFNEIRYLRRYFSSVPIILAGLQYTEYLSIWCLRNRVWDYLCLPHESRRLEKSIAQLKQQSNRSTRTIILPADQEIDHYSRLLNFEDLASTRTKNAIQFIKNHFDKEISVDILAGICRMSVGVFLRVFKKEHNISFTRYINDYRIKMALNYLDNKDLSMQQIANFVGYNCPSYFNRVFKSRVGITPRAFRDVVTLKKRPTEMQKRNLKNKIESLPL